MNRFPSQVFAIVLVLMLWSVPVWSQPPVEAVTANENAAFLRRLWMWRGALTSQDRVGDGTASFGDLFGVGRNAWGVQFGKVGQWRVYMADEFGSLPEPDKPVWTFAAGGITPVVGNFFGDGVPWLVYNGWEVVDYGGKERYYLKYPFYRMGRVEPPTEPEMYFVPWETWRADVVQPTSFPWEGDILFEAMTAVDVNGDGADEFVYVGAPVSEGYRSRVWIFEGGKEFRVDTPTVILQDEEVPPYSSIPRWVFGDFDGDGYEDVMKMVKYESDRVSKLLFWWGREEFLEMSVYPDRVIELEGDPHLDLSFGAAAMNCDNDGFDDLLFVANDGAVYLYRMGIEGKEPRQRTFTLADADRAYGVYGPLFVMGAINDSSGRYPMFGVHTYGGAELGLGMFGFSGGRSGPDATYDAYYSAEADGLPGEGVISRSMAGPVGDIDGDGWEDFLVGNGSWYGEHFNPGIAILFAGGPYIPHDDPTVSVRSVPVAGLPSAVHLWPNPVVDRITIAWRGDLPDDPARLRVADMLGRIVADEGITAAVNGSYSWACDRLRVGSYVLHLVDRFGEPVASLPFVKQ